MQDGHEQPQKLKHSIQSAPAWHRTHMSLSLTGQHSFAHVYKHADQLAVGDCAAVSTSAVV